MATVFISHATVDAALAVQVHRWLVGAGREVFRFPPRSGRHGGATGLDLTACCSARCSVVVGIDRAGSLAHVVAVPVALVATDV